MADAAYTSWAAAVKAVGGVPTVWPFKTGLYKGAYGEPAARFSQADFVIAYSGNKIDTTAPSQSTDNGAYVYVLAPTAVANVAPMQMGTWQRIENSVFTTLDRTATSLGLPSLAGIQGFIVGALTLVAIAGGLYVIAHAKGWQSAGGK